MNGAAIWTAAGLEKRDWKRKQGALANIDLWQALDREMRAIRCAEMGARALGRPL